MITTLCRSLVFMVVVDVALSSDVLELTDGNFKDAVADKSIILVEFFAPWCGHCKRLAPEYETAATALIKNDPPIHLAKVDCVGEGKDSCSTYGVSGYPTLKIFRGGEFSQEYDGPREAAGIIAYMKKNAGPSSVELRDHAHLEKKLSEADEVVVVGYFTGESKLKENFLKAADKKRNEYMFSHTMDNAVMDATGYKDVIVLYRPKHLEAKFEELTVVSSDSTLDADGIVEFIGANEAGLVGQIKPDKDGAFERPLVVVYYKIDWKKNLSGARYVRNRVARVAKKLKDQVTFAIAAKDDYKNKINDWGWESDDDGVHAMAFNAKKMSYKMGEKFSVDNLETFAKEFLDDKLEPYMKSEPIPDANDKPVKVVVGKNFNDIVNDPTKDVLIEFYAPWCGHCKSLEPKYVELAERLKDVKDVVIAKMDATANDVPPQYSVEGFPTIYWAPMGSKDEPKKYEGGREVDDFVEYIKTEATNAVDIPEKKSKKKKKKKKATDEL